MLFGYSYFVVAIGGALSDFVSVPGQQRALKVGGDRDTWYVVRLLRTVAKVTRLLSEGRSSDLSEL